jgi:hypothetical protein
VGQGAKKRVRLQLFRRGIFILQQEIERRKGEIGIMGSSGDGSWSLNGNRLKLTAEDREATFLIDTVDGVEVLTSLSGAVEDESIPELSLANVPLKEEKGKRRTWTRLVSS